jgi:hypothetical protein
MQEFPYNFTPQYKKSFKLINISRLKCLLRQELYNHIVSHEEKEYFSLDEFYSVATIEEGKEIVKEIIGELVEMGWKCKTSFGGTGLFIYSSENPPPNCFEDSIEF